MVDAAWTQNESLFGTEVRCVPRAAVLRVSTCLLPVFWRDEPVDAFLELLLRAELGMEQLASTVTNCVVA